MTTFAPKLDAKRLMEMIKEETKKIEMLTNHNEKKHNPEVRSIFKEVLNGSINLVGDENSENEEDTYENEDYQSDSNQSSNDGIPNDQGDYQNIEPWENTHSEGLENPNLLPGDNYSESENETSVIQSQEEENSEHTSNYSHIEGEIEAISIDLDDMLMHLIAFLQHKTGLKMNYSDAYEFVMGFGTNEN